LEQVTFAFVPELNVRSAGLEKGEVDIAGEIDATDINRLKANKNLQALVTPVPGAPRSLYLNTHKPPLSDVHMRRDLLHAVDKTANIQAFQAGAFQPAFGPLSRVTFGYDASIENAGYVYDQAKAKQLLDQAGWVAGGDGMRAKGGQPL